jgi:hypothetical protein
MKSSGQGIVASSLESAGDFNQERVSGRRKATLLEEIGTVQRRHSCCRVDSSRSDRGH